MPGTDFDIGFHKRHWLRCVFTEGCTHGLSYDGWFWLQLMPPYLCMLVIVIAAFKWRNTVIKLMPNVVPGLSIRYRRIDKEGKATASEKESLVELNFDTRGRMFLPEKRWMIFSLVVPLLFVVWYAWDELFVSKHATYMYPKRLCNDGWDCFYADGYYSMFSWPVYHVMECDAEEEMEKATHFYKCYNWNFSFAQMMAVSADIAALVTTSLLVTVHKCSVDSEDGPISLDPSGTGYVQMDSDGVSRLSLGQKTSRMRSHAHQAFIWILVWLLLSVASFGCNVYFYGEYVTSLAGLLAVPSFFLFLASLTKSREQVLNFIIKEIEGEKKEEEFETDKVSAFLDNVEDLSTATKHLFKAQSALMKTIIARGKRDRLDAQNDDAALMDELRVVAEEHEQITKEKYHRSRNRKTLSMETRILARHEVTEESNE